MDLNFMFHQIKQERTRHDERDTEKCQERERVIDSKRKRERETETERDMQREVLAR